MVDLGSLVLLMSIFGPKVAVAYVLFGLAVAVLGGSLIQRLGLEDQVAGLYAAGRRKATLALTAKDRLCYAKDQMLATLQKVYPYVLVGVAIGAVIHNWIPEDFVVRLLGAP